MSQSSSEYYRQEGNNIYLSVTRNDQKLAPVLARDRLRQAIGLYSQAEGVAGSKDERSSAYKNLGQAYLALASNSLQAEENFECLRKAKKYMLMAENEGQEKSEEWKNRIHTTVEDISTKMMTKCKVQIRENQSKSMTTRINYLWKIRAEFQGQRRLDILKLLAVEHVKRSIVNSNDAVYCDAISDVNAAIQVLDEIKFLGTEESIPKQLEYPQIYQELHEREVACVAYLARETIDDDYNRLSSSWIAVEEDFWEIVDRYQHLVTTIKEKDPEHEALLNSRLGKIMLKDLKNKSQAQVYYTRSFYLAQSLWPKQFIDHEWYNEMIKAKEQLQREEAEKQDESFREERKPYLDELKGELDALEREFNKGRASFLKHLYEKHPPKRESKVNQEEFEKHANGSSASIKLLMKVTRDFHPDKNLEKDFGKKWQILCEEITKWINLLAESGKATQSPSI